MYAIQNIRNKKFVYGTNYEYCKQRKDGTNIFIQLTSYDKALTYAYYESAKSDFHVRRMSDELYKIVKITLQVEEEREV